MSRAALKNFSNLWTAHMNTIDRIQQASEKIVKARPSYKEILDFYSRVYTAQEKSRSSVKIDPIVIPDALLELKRENAMPMADPKDFVIDIENSESLLLKICSLAIDLAPGFSDSAVRIKQAIADRTLPMEELFPALLEKETEKIDSLADRLDISQEPLVLFGYLSMVPSLEANAEQLESYLEPDHIHQKGYCPICGGLPELALFNEDGKRVLKCSFCNHRWQTARMGCVFCSNTDKELQQYFYSKEEEEYRVDLCDHCQTYIKVVDMRKLNRSFHPGLEMMATLHLDMKARKIGYTSRTAPGLQTG